MKQVSLYVVTFVDLVNVGYNVSNTKVFFDMEKANAYMEKEYMKKCKEEDIDTPMADNNFDYQFSKNGFAYIMGKYYWDIFENNVFI